MRQLAIFLFFFLPAIIIAQDLSQGLKINDLEIYPMQDIPKPCYLDTYVDPSFGTTIRRISRSNDGGVVVPMYSTVQAWNADESLMILFDRVRGIHQLLDGRTYKFIRSLSDFEPIDLEQIFWDFNEPNILYYPDIQTDDFVRYNVLSRARTVVANLRNLSGCSGALEMGNDIQMMSWDSNIFTFRCGNETAYMYNISTEKLTSFQIDDVDKVAPAVAPSGERFFHRNKIYDTAGNQMMNLNKASTEHACIGKLPNGKDGYFAIAFAQGPQGGCIGDIIAHDLETGNCFPVISQSQGYDYPQSGTHISALAHKNTEGGWIAASMMGYDKDGQSLLDQELVIAKAEEGNIKVCRIGHHRSDEDDYDYWGEPHAVISPTGTRVLFASDWSGAEDGKSIDCYVVELPAYQAVTTSIRQSSMLDNAAEVYPNPVLQESRLSFSNPTNKNYTLQITNTTGQRVVVAEMTGTEYIINEKDFSTGLYFFYLVDGEGNGSKGKFLVGK